MEYREIDKQALKQNACTTLSKITIIDTGFEMTEDDCVVDWTYEDYRYVPNTGFVGQFVERLLDGTLSQLPSDVILENKEINLKIGIVNPLDNETHWYDYGNFIITKVEERDTTGVMSFQSSDYTKKFNIKYNDSISYPCTALQLANNVCEQVGVELATNGDAYTYIVNESLPVDNYAIKINNSYYVFTVPNELKPDDTITFIVNDDILVLKQIDENYVVTRTNLQYSKVTSTENMLLDVIKSKYCDFINNDFVIRGNQYTNDDDSCRNVIADISKLAYSWARVGTDNKLHFDFVKKTSSDVDTYNELTTEEYYTSTKQDLKFGPVNKVLIGMSQAEGENRYKTSPSYTKENECAIKIYDNNLTYNDKLRLIALNGAESLFDLEYSPLSINSIGHPWLEADDYIKLINVDDDELYSYPFDRKLEYKGYLVSTIQSSAQTSVESKYENSNTLIDKLNRTEFIVDKQNKTISAISSDVGNIKKDVKIVEKANGNPIVIENAGSYELANMTIYGKTNKVGTEYISVKGKQVEDKDGYYIKQITSTGTDNGVALINFTNKDLFNKDNVSIKSIFPDVEEIISNASRRSFVMNCNPNTMYTITRKVIGKRFVAGTTEFEPSAGQPVIDRAVNNSGEKITLQTSENANYLVVQYLYDSTEDEEDILNNMHVYYGDNNKESYELCSVGEVCDTYTNGVITKRTKNNTTVLETPYTINVEYENLKLFDGHNVVTIDSDLLPYLEIEYYLDSVFNEHYVNQSQFVIKTDEISSKVEKTTSLSQEAINGLEDKLNASVYDDFYKTEYTKFTEDSNSFQMDFNTNYKGKINNTETNVLEIKDYIRFENGNIILSGYKINSQQQKEPAEFELKIEKDRIGIYQGGSLLSSWIQDEFTVKTINMGNFAFIPRPNGSLSFRKVK